MNALYNDILAISHRVPWMSFGCHLRSSAGSHTGGHLCILWISVR